MISTALPGGQNILMCLLLLLLLHACDPPPLLPIPLLRHQVYMACRNRAKGEEAAKQLAASYPAAAGRLHVVDCDLEDLRSVKDATNKVRVVGRGGGRRGGLLWHPQGVGVLMGAAHKMEARMGLSRMPPTR